MVSIPKGRRPYIIGGAAVAALFVASLSVTGGGLSFGGLFGGTSSSKDETAAPIKTTAAAPHQTSAPAVVQQLAAAPPVEEPVVNRDRYVYRSHGRIDPFKSLVPSGADGGSDGLPGSEAIQLVGILEADGERRALVEDPQGYGYVLRMGDSVARGIVTKIGEESVVIRYSSYGVTERRVLTLARDDKGRKTHGRLH